MKTDLSYLPPHKQAELAEMVAAIRKIVPAEMIILFGSYARNDWVEEKYDDDHYKYQSDYDILVVVETKSETVQTKYEAAIEEKIESAQLIKTPVSVIVHDIEFVNRRLKKAQYFFSDIKREGALLYDSGNYQLCEPKELLPQERKKLAQDDFDYCFKEAEDFKEGFEFYLSKNKFNKAAFLLHQVTEKLYTGILLVFTRCKPNTHDLHVLRSLTNSVDSRLVKIFSLQGAENRRLFKLLKKAYVDARYNPNYAITQDELMQLEKQVEELKETGKAICSEKINSFISSEQKT